MRKTMILTSALGIVIIALAVWGARKNEIIEGVQIENFSTKVACHPRIKWKFKDNFND